MNNILPNLDYYHIVLGSNSPRRKELLAGLDIPFEVGVIPGIEEDYPLDLPAAKVPLYLAKKKAEAYLPTMKDNELLITADTIVWTHRQILGKPASREEAVAMLHTLSGRVHAVITGVCLTTKQKRESFTATSDVSFAHLKDEEIDYYVDKYKPYDKAGSYGIQEWIGYIGIKSVKGSYFNVMGLPVHKLYQELKNFRYNPYYSTEP